MASDIILRDAATLGSINIFLWLISLPIGKTWPVDFIWSCWPPLMCATIIVRSGSSNQNGDCHRMLIVCTLTVIWGYRLTHNFVSRGGIGHEDWRYTNMRAQFGSHFWWISLFSVFLGQTAFLFGACLSLYGALENALPVGISDAAGSIVCACAILLEMAADIQLDWHQAARREKRTEEVILRTGLWAWSRHPNYLGELMFWWGLWIFGAPVAPRWVVCGPLGITFLFTCISVKLVEDRQLANKGDLYRAYQREVPSPLLLLPPSVCRWFGAAARDASGSAKGSAKSGASKR
jgi:steroid 5-alpha reductase family enzyme